MREALETMCRRCTNYEMCQGTGCHPKNVLAELIEKQIPKAVKAENVANVKALDIEYNKVVTYKCVRCPDCGKWIIANVNHKYCEYCGQKIDWSEIGGDEE